MKKVTLKLYRIFQYGALGEKVYPTVYTAHRDSTNIER